MNFPENEVVAVDISGAVARVVCTCPAREHDLRSIGFERIGSYFQYEVKDQTDRERLVKELLMLGAVFSAGRDWSPSEVVGFYRDQGIVVGPYREIAWTGPDQYSVRIR